MAEFTDIPHHRKRKRRRRQNKPAIRARLVLDDHVKGDIGILSEDLFAELFPAVIRTDQLNGDAPPPQEILHVAISPSTLPTSFEDTNWTVVPVRSSSALAQKTVQFSPSSLALQDFADTLQRTTPSKLIGHRSGFEIRVLDVIPLDLETVFVSIESELAKRLENGEGIFHAEGVKVNGHSKSSHGPRLPEDKLTSAIREALNSLHVVHVGDSFALPLPPHPVTHMLPSPAKVMLCEPVAQGILSPRSRIIITQTHHARQVRKIRSLPSNRALNEVMEEDEDTANDQFYSAAEDRYKTDTAIEDDSQSASETELSSAENGSLSDDSMDDMISLQAPILNVSSPSGISTLQAGTPLGRRTNGINSPGSVYSSFTATTARGSGQRGRLFKAQGLMRALPEESLHPKPAIDEDEEARVFVDVNSLAKIGCFSGDWVRLEAAAESPASGMGLWGLGSFGETEEEMLWRPVKIYGLPESYSHRPVTKIPNSKQDGRRLSFFESQIQKPSSPTVHLSPILLANLESPTHLRLSPLKMPVPQTGRGALPKITSSSRPPFARELTLVKIATPLSMDPILQAALFSGLKRHLKDRMRVVKISDLIGIPVDEGLGRTISQPSSTGDDFKLEEIVLSAEVNSDQNSQAMRNTGVAWFKVAHISHKKAEETTEDAEEEEIWGGAASIDAFWTLIIQSAGVEKSRLPPTVTNTWEYYLKLRQVPKFGPEILNTSMPEPRRQHITPLRRRVRELVAAATSPRAMHLQLQPLAILLVSTQRNIGKSTTAIKACADIGLHTFSIDAYDILSEGGANGGDMKTEATLKLRVDRAMACGPENCALLIRHVEVLTSERLSTALKEVLEESRVLIATTTDLNKVPDGVRALFTHELEMNAPDEGERESILRGVIEDQGTAIAADVDLSAVAVKTAALVAGDLVDVVDRALVAKRERLESLASQNSSFDHEISIRDVQVAGGPSGRCLIKTDFDTAVDAARKNFADAIGAPKIPNVSWDDVGGLTNVKDAVMETIQLPLERPELFAKGMKKRSGILFYGPPGTGKTLLAKAIATEFSLNFFSVKGPELLNMYIGESEANVRRVFQRARDARPCVVFFDELDSVAPKRGNQGDSGGVMDRIVSQLLAELDGMSDGEDGGGGVFVIGATNRPDLLDAALLRPGRFDKMLYLGVSDTHEKQLTIMEALTRKFTMHPKTSLRRVAETLPFTYTGADFYALCSDAMLKAVTRQASAVDEKIKKLPGGPVSTAYFFDHYATKEDIAVMVTEEDFVAAQKELIPSVSAKELEHYARVRQTFEAVDEKKTVSAPTDGVPQKLMPIMSSKPNGKGKGRAVSYKGNGKGKEKLNVSDDDEEHYYDGGSAAAINGSIGKGKGKAVDTGFQDSTFDDDEGLY